MFILTEKSNVAADFAKGLGGFQKKEGFWVNSKGDCIVGAQGHLLTLKMPEDYDEKYKKWSLEHLPILPSEMEYKLINSNINIYRKIKECVKNFDSTDLILATDADREGELIGRLILKSLGFKNWKNARRFWVSEALDENIIKKGISEAKPLMSPEYEKLYKMGIARQHADWYVGLNITRLLSCNVRKKLNFGRVQTAVLNAVCKRNFEIENFKSVPFYELEATVFKGEKSFKMLLLNQEESTRFDSKENLEINVEELVVDDLSIENKKEEPPLLFNITGLQKYCASVYQLDPSQTLQAAQTLYDEKKCLSYPRTSSQYMGDDNVDLIKEKYELLAKNYPNLADGSSDRNIINVSKRIFNSQKVEGHHALIPLAPLPPDSSEILENVYNAVLLRFFQVFKDSYEYKSITVKASKDKFNFIAHGKTVINEGWRKDINNEEDESDENFENNLPELKKGDNLFVQGLNILTKKTKPPRAYTDSSILSLMENPKNEDENKIKLVGLGTPATRANIIKELFNNGYLIKNGKKIVPTDLGKFLISTVNQFSTLAQCIRLDNTTRWEELLNADPDKFLENIKKFVSDATKLKIETQWKAPDKESLGICPACKKGNILEGSKGYYCSLYKDGCKFSIWKNISGAKISVSDIKLLLGRKKTKMKKMVNKAGKEFNAALVLDDSNAIKFVFEKKK